MKIDIQKVKQEQNRLRALKTENRDDYRSTDDADYRYTLDNTWHLYEGELNMLRAVLEGRFAEETAEPLNDPENPPAKKRGRGPKKGRK